MQVAHGNEDTFREMLRIRRSVAASYSLTHFNTSIIDAATTGIGTPPLTLCQHPACMGRTPVLEGGGF